MPFPSFPDGQRIGCHQDAQFPVPEPELEGCRVSQREVKGDTTRSICCSHKRRDNRSAEQDTEFGYPSQRSPWSYRFWRKRGSPYRSELPGSKRVIPTRDKRDKSLGGTNPPKPLTILGPVTLPWFRHISPRSSNHPHNGVNQELPD
jgi:hypothetical protein